MKAELLQWDSQYLWYGVIHEGIKPENRCVENNKPGQHMTKETGTIVSYLGIKSVMSSLPEFRVKSEAEAVSDSSRSPLPLEGAGFGDKRFHQ